MTGTDSVSVFAEGTFEEQVWKDYGTLSTQLLKMKFDRSKSW
jgi:hypothetical protein